MSLLIGLEADVKRAIAEGEAALARCMAKGDAKEIAECKALIENLHDVIEHLSHMGCDVNEGNPAQPN